MMMARHKESEKNQVQSDTRQRLLDAAAGEIAREGYIGANINRISQAAGFAKGTVYNYFPSKQALLLALIDQTAALQNGIITEYVARSDDPAERLRLFYEGGFQFVKLHPDRARTIIGVLYGPNEDFKLHMWQSYKEMFRIMQEDIVQYGIQRGAFRQVDLQNTVALLITIYLGGSVGGDEQGRVWLDPAYIADFALRSLWK